MKEQEINKWLTTTKHLPGRHDQKFHGHRGGTALEDHLKDYFKSDATKRVEIKPDGDDVVVTTTYTATGGRRLNQEERDQIYMDFISRANAAETSEYSMANGVAGTNSKTGRYYTSATFSPKDDGRDFEKTPLAGGGTWGDVLEAIDRVAKKTGLAGDLEVRTDTRARGNREIAEIKTESPGDVAQELYKLSGGVLGGKISGLHGFDPGDYRFVTQGPNGQTEFRVLGPYSPSVDRRLWESYYKEKQTSLKHLQGRHDQRLHGNRGLTVNDGLSSILENADRIDKSLKAAPRGAGGETMELMYSISSKLSDVMSDALPFGKRFADPEPYDHDTYPKMVKAIVQTISSNLGILRTHVKKMQGPDGERLLKKWSDKDMTNLANEIDKIAQSLAKDVPESKTGG